jgi:hypothetical protein
LCFLLQFTASDDCTCAISPFIYYPTSHVITGDLKIINNTSLRDVLPKGPKSINWKHNFKTLMDSVEDYARQLAKREKEDLDTLSEWVKSVRSLIQISSRYLGPFANTSRREVLLIILRSPVITWPAGLYMNGELAQAQSGG